MGLRASALVRMLGVYGVAVGCYDWTSGQSPADASPPFDASPVDAHDSGGPLDATVVVPPDAADSADPADAMDLGPGCSVPSGGPGACNGVPQLGQGGTSVWQSTNLPLGMGGTVADGVYVLTAVNTAGPCSTLPFNRETVYVCGLTWHSNENGNPITTFVTYGSGSNATQ